jgi:cyclohexyl-isocyanide hydratase
MKIAYVMFNGVTWLDLIGVYDAVSRLRSMKFIPDLTWEMCAFTDTAQDNFGLQMVPQKIRQPLNDYDAIIVPGGHGTRTLVNDAAFLTWIKTANDASYKISICTGSLLLGAAGFLHSKKATTNFLEYESLRPYCREVVKEKIVEDGKVITAGAVTASIDLGLYLCEKWSGSEARRVITERMGY